MLKVETMNNKNCVYSKIYKYEKYLIMTFFAGLGQTFQDNLLCVMHHRLNTEIWCRTSVSLRPHTPHLTQSANM